ncbi:hypothetical protein [Chthonobacter albigriseus]|uniref:hypothetical protein n=1 Tax=Chthonobacter albigriseus TaxID=1683161 RepID=UPI0015EEEF53|nr:hypothetical protein [Chthonobacter albigriseus]
MEIEDFETIHLAHELAREKGWEHVMETIRKALREENEAKADAGDIKPPRSH